MIARSACLLFSLLALLLPPALAHAQAQDPARAREHLRQGYELKTQGRYAEALNHLLESLRLDSQLKTILNVADCEEHLLRFTDARQHWLLARDNARLQGNEDFRREAELRLQALERRMPQLVVTFDAPPPADTRVDLDGAVLGQTSWGAPLPVNPGRHVVSVQVSGHAARAFEITLREGERLSLQLAPGPALDAADSADSRRRVQHFAAVGAAGLGLVALGVATVSWLDASSTHEDALGHCVPRCSDRARSLQSEAKSAARLGNVSAAVGGVLIGSGLALWLTAPSAPSSKTATLRLVPALGPRFGGVAAQGAFP